mgnify:FL=1
MGPDFLKPKAPLGEKIQCLSFTKDYFYKNNISPEKSRILKVFTKFEDIPIQYMNQVHGNRLETIFSHSSFPIDETDSLFSSTSNLALGVLTADCRPIALSKNDGSEFAILHAGWKGLLSGVIESTLTTFTKGCSDVSAWIGPSISLKNYEVGNDLYESFIDKDDGSESNFIEKGHGKWLFSLHGEAKRILDKYDINADFSSECTFESESLFSYRRDQTENRILSIIWRNE